ncbi:MAG: hypothetical protein AAB434_01205 [Planctomycetota bacterium]
MGDAALGSHLRDASRTYNDPNALYELGYELLERGLSGVAATVLSRTNDLAPGRPKVLGELAFALGDVGQSEEVLRVLRGVPELAERDFVLSYMLAFHSIMTRDMAEAARRLPKLLADAQNAKSTEFPPMAKTIEGILAREDAVRHATRLDDDDLRGWQFVVNGHFLLHVSPHGEEVMRGRYGYVNDSPALCHEGIRRLAALFDVLDLKPARVFFLADRASEALGRAAARELGIGVSPWPKEGTTSPGLVVADDMRAFPRETLATVLPHAAGQPLWAQARCWTQHGPFAEDCATLLYQARTTPWDATMQVDSATKEVQPGKPVEGTPEQLASRILDARVDTDALADLPELVSLARAACKMTGEHAPGLVRTKGKRRKCWVESPVRSNRFL